MISHPASPSIHSTTRPRTTTGSNGLSVGVSDRATRGSRRRLRALRERGPVRKTIWSPRVAIQSGTVWGEPSGSTVATWARAVLSKWRRTSGSSISTPSSVPSRDFTTVAVGVPLRNPKGLGSRHAAHELRRDGVLDRAHARHHRGALVTADPAGRLGRHDAVRADPGRPRHLAQGPHRA